MARHVNFTNLGVSVDNEDLPAVVRAARRADDRAHLTLVQPASAPVEAPVAPNPKPRRRKARTVSASDWRAQLEDREIPRSFAPTAASAPVIAPALAPVAPPTPSPIPAPEASVPAQTPAASKTRVVSLDPNVRFTFSHGLALMVVVFHAVTWVGFIRFMGVAFPWAESDWAIRLLSVAVPTVSVWGVFALLAGLGAHELKGWRWAAIGALSLFNLYGSFSGWESEFAGHGADTEMARAAHREFRGVVLHTLEAEAEAAQMAFRTAQRELDDEIQGKASTPGDGPKAQRLRAGVNEAHSAAEAAKAKVDRLAPYFSDDVFGLSPLEMWDRANLAAAAVGKTPPPRDAYYEIPYLAPLFALGRSSTAAWIALAFAFFFDGVGILLGKGLHRHD